MKPEQRQALRNLLETQRILALSVLIEGEPYVGLLPYVITGNFEGALVHASGLARHSKGLGPDAPFSILIHAPDGPDVDPLQIPRVTLEGKVEVLDKESPSYVESGRRYIDRFPTSARTFSLGDFQLYRLRFERGRYVAGFAQTLNLSPATLRELI